MHNRWQVLGHTSRLCIIREESKSSHPSINRNIQPAPQQVSRARPGGPGRVGAGFWVSLRGCTPAVLCCPTAVCNMGFCPCQKMSRRKSGRRMPTLLLLKEKHIANKPQYQSRNSSKQQQDEMSECAEQRHRLKTQLQARCRDNDQTQAQCLGTDETDIMLQSRAMEDVASATGAASN